MPPRRSFVPFRPWQQNVSADGRSFAVPAVRRGGVRNMRIGVPRAHRPLCRLGRTLHGRMHEMQKLRAGMPDVGNSIPFALASSARSFGRASRRRLNAERFPADTLLPAPLRLLAARGCHPECGFSCSPGWPVCVLTFIYRKRYVVKALASRGRDI